MRLVKASQGGLIVGIVVGLLALWAGAAPTLGTGDSVIGGFTKWYVVWAYQGGYIGCTENWWGCKCAATVLEACCSAWDGNTWLNCSGGYVSVGSYNGSEPYATAGSLAGCSGGGKCGDIQDSSCE